MMNSVTFVYPLVSVIIELILLYMNMHYVILLDIIQMLMCLGNWNSIFMRQEVSTPAAYLNAVHQQTVWTPRNEDDIIAAFG
jgi:hypothetical protein